MVEPSKPTRRPRGGIIIAAIIVALLAFGAISHAVKGSKASTNIGDTVQLNAGTGIAMPAGDTRSDYDKVITALNANDNIGLANLTTDGAAIPVSNCATGKLLDTAIGGERQVRIETDSGHPANIGLAVWVDAEWVKSTSDSCP